MLSAALAAVVAAVADKAGVRGKGFECNIFISLMKSGIMLRA